VDTVGNDGGGGPGDRLDDHAIGTVMGDDIAVAVAADQNGAGDIGVLDAVTDVPPRSCSISSEPYQVIRDSNRGTGSERTDSGRGDVDARPVARNDIPVHQRVVLPSSAGIGAQYEAPNVISADCRAIGGEANIIAPDCGIGATPEDLDSIP